MELLYPVSDIVKRQPRAVVAAIVAITVLMMTITALNPQDPTFDQTSFLPDHEVIRAQDDISEKLASTQTVPLLIHARTPESQPNMLTSAAMVELLELEWALTNDTTIRTNLTVPQAPLFSFVSLPHLLGTFFDPNATDFGQLITVYRHINDTTLQQTLAQVGAIPGLSDFVISLVSKDYTTHPGHEPDLLEDLDQHPQVAKATLLLVQLNSTTLPGETTSQQFKRLGDVELVINDLVKENQGTNLRAVVLSQTVLDDEVNTATQKTTQMLLGLAFLLIIGILVLIYRSATDLIFSLLALIFAIMWVNGFTVILGFEASVFSMIVPILLVGLGVDYGIHLTMRYRETLVEDFDVKRSSTTTIVSVGAALVLATVTTMVGFLSNASSPVGVMKEFGVTVALGILSAFIIFVTFVPACKVWLDSWKLKQRRLVLANLQQYLENESEAKLDSLASKSVLEYVINQIKPLFYKGSALLSPGNERRARRRKEEQQGISVYFTRILDQGATLALAKPQAVVAAVIPLTLGLLLLASQLSTVFNFEDFLPDGLEITEEFRFMGENFESPDESAAIYIRGSVATPQVMAAINATQLNMADDERVLLRTGSPESPLTIMQDWADASDVSRGGNYDANFSTMFTAADTDGDLVPEANVAELLDWLMEHHPEKMASTLYRDKATGEYTLALIKINTNSENVQFVAEVHQELRDDSQPLEALERSGELEQVVVTGQPAIFDVVLTTINDSMLNSIVITVVVALVVLTAVFYFQARSLVLGFLTTLPVILVMVWILGTMVPLDIPLNFMTILIGALTVGLGITYAIHITHRFVEELEEHGDIEKASHQTVKSTGSALSGAAMTTMVGFGVLIFSVQPPMQQFGKLTALTILYSFLASVFVLPSLLVLWARSTQGSAPVHPLCKPGATLDTLEERAPPGPAKPPAPTPAKESEEAEEPKAAAGPPEEEEEGEEDVKEEGKEAVKELELVEEEEEEPAAEAESAAEPEEEKAPSK